MGTVEKISVALSPDLAEVVRKAVAGGKYGSASEVIREALREWTLRAPLREAEIERLRRQWREGLESGPSHPFDVEDIKRRARERLFGTELAPKKAERPIRINPAADEDLIDIWCAIAQDSPAAADRMIDRINERISQLASFPQLAPARPDIGTGARALTVGNYLVLYHVQSDAVEIVRIVHGARDLTALL